LHNQWDQKEFVWKMGIPIITGSVLSFALNALLHLHLVLRSEVQRQVMPLSITGCIIGIGFKGSISATLLAH